MDAEEKKYLEEIHGVNKFYSVISSNETTVYIVKIAWKEGKAKLDEQLLEDAAHTALKQVHSRIKQEVIDD